MNEPINLLLKMLYYFEIECIYLFGFWSNTSLCSGFSLLALLRNHPGRFSDHTGYLGWMTGRQFLRLLYYFSGHLFIDLFVYLFIYLSIYLGRGGKPISF